LEPDPRRSSGGDPRVTLFAFKPLGAALLGVGLFVTVPISVLMMASIERQPRATAHLSPLAERF
jgi:hypothetical protein